MAEAVAWSLFAHLVWIGLSAAIFGQRFEPLILIRLLSSAPQAQVDATLAVANGFGWISAYFCSLFAAAFAIPTILRYLISEYRLDRAAFPLSSVFRFHDAPWYYLLTGADFTEDDKPDFIVVSAIVEVAKEAILYVGVLDEFFVDSEGQLDRMVLQDVSRRPIRADKNSGEGEGANDDDRFYEVDGDSFVLRYRETITLNIQYVRLTSDQGP